MAVKTTSFKYSLWGGQFEPDLPDQFAPGWGGQVCTGFMWSVSPDLPKKNS